MNLYGSALNHEREAVRVEMQLLRAEVFANLGQDSLAAVHRGLNVVELLL